MTPAEAPLRDDDSAPRLPVWWRGAGVAVLGVVAVAVVGSAIILVLVEELWVLAVAIVAAAALLYAVTAWLNGDWDS